MFGILQILEDPQILTSQILKSRGFSFDQMSHDGALFLDELTYPEIR
jgi:hypothetical protein